MEKIGNLLEHSLKKANISNEAKANYVCSQWERVVGEVFTPQAAIESKAEAFSNKTLFIKVSSSGWAQEFQFQQNILVKELNENIGKEVIKRIVFKF